jgi:RES domain-containing protein
MREPDVTLWRIATDTKDFEAHDLSGKGAEATGGRWNRPGRPVVYTAASVSLACLETVVHLHAQGLPLNRFLVRLEVPDDVWARRQTLGAAELPVGWSAIPEGKASLDVGDAWLRAGSRALLVVPSVIVPEEFNVLINPLHADAKHIKAQKMRAWFYDQRLG